MRNLKRALSLTLASVMLLGMMVFGTSAVSYSDADSITNVEAVDVMNASEIMLGSGGKFMPNQTVTRAQMAIIVVKMLYGSDMNVKQFEGETNFTDVPANAYYSGYVNLASQLGIINGYGNGKFGPAAPVTTAQAALMLTKALGYFQDNSELGDSWVLSAITKATEIGLFGDLKLDRNAGLRRDDVAEMTFNAITKATPVTKNEIFGYYTVGVNLTDGVVDGEEQNAKYFNKTLAYKAHDLTYITDYNHGESGRVWQNRLTSSNVTDFYPTNNVLGTSTDGTVISKLTNKSDSKFQAELDSTPTFYYNGTEIGANAVDGALTETTSVKYPNNLYVNNGTVYYAASGTADVDADPEYSKKGTIVSFLDEKESGIYDGNAEIVTIVEKTVTKLSRDAATETSGSVTKLRYAVGVADAGTNVAYVHGYEGLMKDDVVLSVKLANGFDNKDHYYIEKAETVAGEVTRIRNTGGDDRYTLDSSSTAYEESGLVTAGKGIDTTDAALGNKVEFALDNGGYVVNTKLTEDNGRDYALVVDYDARTMSGQQTKLLLVDGTKATVTADYIVGSDTKKMMDGTASQADEVNVPKGQTVVKYTVENNVYKLKALEASSSTVEGQFAVSTIEKNKAQLASGKYADNETVYLVLNDDESVSRYVGVANVPDVTATNKIGVGKGSIASYVFASGSVTAATNDDDLIYLASTTYQRWKDTEADVYVRDYQAVRKGEIETIQVLDSIASTIDATGVYKITGRDSNGYVSLLDDYDGSSSELYYAYDGKISNTYGVMAKEVSGDTLIYTGGWARITKDTVAVKVGKSAPFELTASEVGAIDASTTPGVKASLITVVYAEKDGALTEDAAVIFIYHDDFKVDPAGQPAELEIPDNSVLESVGDPGDTDVTLTQEVSTSGNTITVTTGNTLGSDGSKKFNGTTMSAWVTDGDSYVILKFEAPIGMTPTSFSIQRTHLNGSENAGAVSNGTAAELDGPNFFYYVLNYTAASDDSKTFKITWTDGTDTINQTVVVDLPYNAG